MTSINPPPLTVVEPGERLVIDPMPGTVGVTVKLWGADTGGAVSIAEPAVQPHMRKAQRQRDAQTFHHARIDRHDAVG